MNGKFLVKKIYLRMSQSSELLIAFMQGCVIVPPQKFVYETS